MPPRFLNIIQHLKANDNKKVNKFVIILTLFMVISAYRKKGDLLFRLENHAARTNHLLQIICFIRFSRKWKVMTTSNGKLWFPPWQVMTTSRKYVWQIILLKQIKLGTEFNGVKGKIGGDPVFIKPHVLRSLIFQ